MPTVTYRGRDIECEEGAVLRDVLLEAGETPHNGRSRWLNCHGMATCGTCAVEVAPATDRDTREGGAAETVVEASEASDPADAGAVNAMGSRERRRLSFPPHDPDAGLRLSCQTRVYDDVVVTKHDGFWGQHVPEPTDG